MTETPESCYPWQLVDHERYPLGEPEALPYRRVVSAAREQMQQRGAAELTGFLTSAGVAALVDDADRLAERAHASGGQGTAYLEFPDFSLSADHPRLQFADYAVRAVPYDVMPRSSALRQLYEWDPVKDLIEAVLDRGPLFRYADPFGALNLAVMGPGDRLQWHFDQTDFVVSLAIQSAEEGGDFEVVPRLRNSGSEHYDDVAAVLGGERSGVQILAMTPGTLLIFEGRHSLHRVGTVGGRRWRHVGLLAYDTFPGTMGSELLRADRYGRTEPFAEPPARWPLDRGHGPVSGPSQFGESFIGEGPDAAHVNTVLGSVGGPIETAWVTALATPRAGHAAFVVVAAPGTAVRPFTLFVNKAAIDGERHGELTWGAAQAGVAGGVLDAVAEGVIDPTEAGNLLLIAAVWVNPLAADEGAVYRNNRLATAAALRAGRDGHPLVADALAVRHQPFNAFYAAADHAGS